MVLLYSHGYGGSPLTYKIIDTGLEKFFDNLREIQAPRKGEPFYGQDAHYHNHPFAFRDNGDGSITDLNTGLMWRKSFARNLKWDEIPRYLESLNRGKYSDWRLPTIKELLSIADFRGNLRESKPYINTKYFDFEYPVGRRYIFQPDPRTGKRYIDAQYISSTEYVGRIMRGDEGVFGFNFADGHLKCYPKYRHPRGTPTFYVRAVRGESLYGRNKLVDNGDGTVSDLATGLMWQKIDDGVRRNWREALAYAENLKLAGYDDWHLPDVKELHSIVDYSKIPAIAPPLRVSDPDGWYWTSTTYLDNPKLAIYIAFGRAVNFRGVDTHGAGAIRGDPKDGDPADYPRGLGPQGDEVRIKNLVRCVRKIR